MKLLLLVAASFSLVHPVPASDNVSYQGVLMDSPAAGDTKISLQNADAFWYERITHSGSSPYIPGGAKWRVYRHAVNDYAADNSGSQDASVAIQNAINGRMWQLFLWTVH